MTKIVTINKQNLKLAATIIKDQGTVVFPTETVYGLGANGLSTVACQKIFAAKGRPADNPLILHIAEQEQIKPLVSHIPKTAEQLMEAFWPGALTLVLKKSDNVPDIVSAGLNSVAIRLPQNQIARDLIRLAELPIAAPSANLSGSPSPTTAEHVIADLDGRVDMILKGDASVLGLESTVVSLLSTKPIILRPGAITLEMLQTVLPETELAPHILEVKQIEEALSPGMKYKHYSPRAEVYVLKREYTTAEINRIKSSLADKKVLIIRENASALAQNLYSYFRNADKEGYQIILVQAVETTGLGLAVMNRLLKAANYRLL